MTNDILPVLRDIMIKIEAKDYEKVVSYCSASRLTAEDIKIVVNEYGKSFMVPPPSAFEIVDAVLVRDTDLPTWSLRVPLWSKEEGRSDLEMQLTVRQRGKRWDVELDDMLVP